MATKRVRMIPMTAMILTTMMMTMKIVMMIGAMIAMIFLTMMT